MRSSIASAALFLVLAVAELPSTSAQAMMCEPDPLDEQIANADAVMKGTVIAVRYVPNSLLDAICWKNEPGDHEICGAKIATVSVSGIWKGELPSEISVYSQDACYCTGEYFFERQEMFLVLTRYRGVKSPTINVDYRTYSCGKSMSLGDAEKEGIIGHLNSQMPLR